MTSEYDQLDDKVTNAQHRLMLAKKQAKAARLAHIANTDATEYAIEAQGIIQAAVAAAEQRIHAQVAPVVCRCLEAVFEEPYEFELRFERKRGRSEANLVFIRGGVELTNPQDEAGGGVIDVAAFALRLAALMMQRPKLRRLLVLDEPFRYLSADNRPRVRALLARLAEEFGMQVVMVTHTPELAPESGVVVDLS